MNDWYSRQFGDKESFAVAFSLGRPPHVVTEAHVAWGGFSLWVSGRCLTRSVSDESGVLDEVRWNLAPILRWFVDEAVRLVNEEPFPEGIRADRVRDACDWYDLTEVAPLSLTDAEEDRWFARRSEWRTRHALRRAADDVALPNIIFRRLGHHLEVSWDNDSWGSSRPNLSFIEKRGTALLDARHASAVLQTAIRSVTKELAAANDGSLLVQLADDAASMSLSLGDWRWLIHDGTAQAIESAGNGFLADLEAQVAENHDGIFLPHTRLTSLLRQVATGSIDDVRALMSSAGDQPKQEMSELLVELVKPSPAPTVRPWVAGNERAEEVRETLGWGHEPVPDLPAWLVQHHVDVLKGNLPSSVDLFAMRTGDMRARTLVNPCGPSRIQREVGLATALGHILMDEDQLTLDGTDEHWPTAARARAFGVALLLPEEGVRAHLGGAKRVDVDDVKKLMSAFHTGPFATTFRLRNLGLLTDERRNQIAYALTH